MPEEERARLKKQYVEELRERKKMRQTFEAARKGQAIDRALGDMAETLANAGGTVDEFTARLNAETALNEARMEIALDHETPLEDPAATDKDSTKQPAPSPAKTIGRQLRSSTSDQDS